MTEIPAPVGAPGVRNAQRLARWRHLRSTALALYLQHGFQAVSIDDIAAAGGVSRRTFFNYFPTKVAVLVDPDPEEHARLRAMLDAPHDDPDDWATLTRVVRDYLTNDDIATVTARRRITGANPEIMLAIISANGVFGDVLVDWLTPRVPDPFVARVRCAMLLGVVRECFGSWQPDDGAQALRDRLDEGFAIARDLHAVR